MIARTSTLGTQPHVKRSKGAIRLAEWVKAPAAKPDDESSLSGTHGWKVRTDFPKLSSGLHTLTVPGVFTPRPRHTGANRISN